MNKKYQCHNCTKYLPTLIDLNYHLIGCENLAFGKVNQEEKDYDWLKKNNYNSCENKSSLKTKTQPKNKLSNTLKNGISLSKIINCPHCNSTVRVDRLQKHIDKVHSPINFLKLNENYSKEIKNKNPFFTKKPIIHVFRSNGKKNEPKSRLRPNHLQDGKITGNNPSPKFGEEIGAILKKEKNNGIEIRYEQALCSCNGNNERCMRCDGTGYYAKKIIEESDENSSKFHIRNKIRSTNPSSTQESNFSNDFGGDDYGIRECGRFNSNPLHDDYD